MKFEKVTEKPSRGKLLIASCRSGMALATSVLKSYKESVSFEGDDEKPIFLGDIDFSFRDSETCVRLEVDVSGCDVFLFQGLCDPESDGSVDRKYSRQGYLSGPP